MLELRTQYHVKIVGGIHIGLDMW